jgi:uncharacterized protein
LPTQDDTVTDDATLAPPPPVTSPAGPWKFWGTTLWGLAMLAVGLAINVIGIVALLFQLDPGPDLTPEQLVKLLLGHMTELTVIFGLSYATAFGVLLLAVWPSRLSLRDYLALNLPRVRDVLIGLAGIVVFFVGYALIAEIVGPDRSSSHYISDLYRGARAANALPLLAVLIVVVAPVSEEIFVRGFLLRGWAASRLGAVGAVVLTSLVWTALHAGYDALALGGIFIAGLWLGWIRLRSGSTLVTILLHAVQNAAAMVTVAMYRS